MYCRLFQFDVRAEQSDDFRRTALQYIDGWLRESLGWWPEGRRAHERVVGR